MGSKLQEEIRQRKPFATPAQEAFLGILRTADVLRRYASSIVEPHGVTPQQYNVLRILRGAGNEGLPTLEVADRMIEQTPGVTRLLDRLEVKELVRRQRCSKDRRQHLCWITTKGLALLQKLDAPTMRAHAEKVKGINEADLQTLIRLLDAVRAAHS
jgi:DNA-binding MarR family transcriptional regulator